MNLPPISEEMLVLCMALATMAGILLGFALGYGLKERHHEAEIESIIRIAKRVSEGKKERAPKDPPTIDIKFGDGKVHKVYGRPC